MAGGLLEAPAPPQVERPRNGHGRPPLPPTGGGDDGGGFHPPRPLDNLRIALVFFIAAESMFFAALISALFVVRSSLPVWPPPLQPRLPIGVTSANTVILLASSVAMVWAQRGLARGNRGQVVRGLAVAALLGTIFLGVQGFEWVRLIGHGLTLSSSTYGSTFYTLIGTHALHVLGALVWLDITLCCAARRRVWAGGRAIIGGCALYWHFVVMLWLVLFVAVYLA